RTGADLPAELLRFARFENVTQIVIGRSRDSFLSELLRRSLPHELVRRTQDIAIHLVTREGEASASTPWLRWPKTLSLVPLHFIYATLAVVHPPGVVGVPPKFPPFPTPSMFFLWVFFVTAIRFVFWPAIYALVFSFFF